MALNAWQKLTRVLTNKPFGSGVDGDLTISSSATQTQVKGTASVAIGNTALTTNTTSFVNGDIVLIHQSRGTGVGQWEVNKIASGGGTTNLVLSIAANYGYTTGAQIIKIPQYNNVTINSSQTWSAPAWDGNTGGFLLFAAKKVLTVNGILNAANLGYEAGSYGLNQTAGYRGGGSVAANTTQATTANGSAPGGSKANSGSDSGAAGTGGAHATQGSQGGGKGSYTLGALGATVGASSLTSMFFGAGGSGYGMDAGGAGSPIGVSGKGGGAIVIFAKEVAAPNSIIAKGQDGTNGQYNGGAGGAGGSILICSETLNIGVDKVSVTRGNRGAPTDGGWTANYGGYGGYGRIAAYYGKTITGSIAASLYGSYTNELDTEMIERGGSPLFFNQV